MMIVQFKKLRGSAVIMPGHAGELCSRLDSLLQLDAGAKQLGITLAYTVAWEEEATRPLPQSLFDEVVSRLRSMYRVEDLARVPEVRAYRDFYWRLGVDPTKTRPSSEALLRRALRGSVPRIHPVVDAGNLASLETLVPVGVYDLERAKPPLLLSVSRGGEKFYPLGGGEEVLGPGVPVLLDSSGVVMHLYPHRDSVLTAVTERTRLALVVAAGVPGISPERLRETILRIAGLLGAVGWACCSTIALK